MIEQTQYDLRFSVFGLPVRVHPAFWVVGAVMGYSPGWAGELGVNVMAVCFLWCLVLFVSILIHELGHAWMAESFGWPTSIVLYHFGGLAAYRAVRGYSFKKQIAVAFAGPGAGFIFYGIIRAGRAIAQSKGWVPPPIPWYVISGLERFNLYWGLINLLPVLPLDGGQICLYTMKQKGVRNPEQAAAKTGLVTGIIVAVAFLVPIKAEALVRVFGETVGMFLVNLGVGSQSQFVGILFIILAVGNFHRMQGRRVF